MYNSQLIKILKTLTKPEVKELSKFVQSPYFNAKKEAVDLFDFLAKNHGSPPSVFEKEKVFAHLFPKKDYDDAVMRLLIHQLLKTVKSYFIQKELETDEINAQIVLARAFRRRGFDDFFEKEIALAAKMNTENTHRNAHFYFKNYLIQTEQLRYITATRRKGEVPYKQISDSLLYFFAAELLRHSCEAQSYKTIIGKDIQLEFLAEISSWLERKTSENTEGEVLSKMYFNTLKMLQTSNNQYFEYLKNKLKEHNDIFTKEEISFLYSAAMNFCARKINNGESTYLVEVFDLLQTGLANKVFFENGFLSKFIYKNAVTTGLRLEKYEWVKQFLEEYKPVLHPKDRDASYFFNLAVYHFRLKNYNEAMILLQKSDFGDTLSTLTAKGMLLKIYYEMNAFDALMSLLDSFSAFIQRQKDIGYLGKNYQNLIRFTRKLVNLKPNDNEERVHLRNEIEQTQNVVEKDWLLEKLM